MPYISASIIVQMMAMVVPQWMEYRKEGESGRRKLTEITRYGTLGLALFQSFVTASGLQAQGMRGGAGLAVPVRRDHHDDHRRHVPHVAG